MCGVQNGFSAAAHWIGDFGEHSFQRWVEELRARLGARPPSLALVFISPQCFSNAKSILEIVRVHGRVPLVAGCSSQGLIAGEHEIEENSGVAVGLYHLPGADLRGFHFTQADVEDSDSADFWPQRTGIASDKTNGWLAFLDPFHIDSERWLNSWNKAYAPAPVIGGLASGNLQDQLTQVYLDGEVYEEGGVAVSVSGEVALQSLTSQGCTPIGETWTLTGVEDNVIRTIGNRPAYEVLADTFSKLTPEEQRKARGNLFLGLVVNEYLEEFHRGDFLIRNLLGADPNTGALAVGALPRAGQTVQFQRRSAAAATEDLSELLGRLRNSLGQTIYGGCLCSCNGRGRGLFSKPDHDAGMIQHTLGPMGLAGFFCNGEIGPIGNRNFLHGYTASLALFVSKQKKE